MPLLNLDVGFSAFLSAGPAIEVIAKMLGGPARGGRGGFGRGGGGPSMGGPGSHGADLHTLDSHQIGMIKNKLRGMKVGFWHISLGLQADT